MARVQTCASIDARAAQIGIEQDPGSAGVFEAHAYLELLRGYAVRAIRPTGDKVTRARIPSAACERHKVKLLRGPWNNAFLDELEAFPDGAHDDQVDAFSGAFSMVSVPRPHLRDLDRWMPLMPKARWASVGAKRPQRRPLTAHPPVFGWHPYRKS